MVPKVSGQHHVVAVLEEVHAQRPAFGTQAAAPATPTTEQEESASTYAVDMRGRLIPWGTAHRLAWFLVTALPPRDEVSSAQWTLLAGFLDAQGEPVLAARMRRFQVRWLRTPPPVCPSGWAVSGLEKAASACHVRAA